MAFVKEVQLDMPDSFPAAEFESFRRWARVHLLDPKEDAWGEFASSSNLIAWRFRATFEGMDRYHRSWIRKGAGADFEDLYERELALFQMFASGVSCGEATCYAIHACLSDRRVFGVPFGAREQRRTGPSELPAVLRNLPASNLAAIVNGMINSTEWDCWISLRNRMSHRSNLPQRIVGAVGAAPPPAKAIDFAGTSSTQDFVGDLADLEGLVDWLAVQLRMLMLAMVALP